MDAGGVDDVESNLSECLSVTNTEDHSSYKCHSRF